MATSDITTTTLQEEWRDIPGYEGLYLVSNLGRVRSLPRNGNYMRKSLTDAMRPSSANGYQILILKKGGTIATKSVHRLVMLAFAGAPVDGQEVNHIDGDKSNNHLTNLEYCTRGENISHAHKLGLRNARGEKNARAKLTNEDVHTIRRRFALGGISMGRLSREYGVSRSTIRRMLDGTTWKHLSAEDDS